jgi:hypothetical protein
MELKELNPAERLALAALVRFSVMSDGTLSENEAGEIGFLVTEMGEETYRVAVEAAFQRVKDQDSLKAVLAEVTNPEARELIYGTLLEVAIPETIDPRESRLLDFVATEWGLTPTFEDFPAEEGDDAPQA